MKPFVRRPATAGLAIAGKGRLCFFQLFDPRAPQDGGGVNSGPRLQPRISLLGFDPRKYRDRLDQSPCALNILDFKDVAHARLTLFNDTSHYTVNPDIPAGRLSKVWAQRT